MSIPLAIESGSNVVDPANDMNVLSHRQQRSQARRHLVIRARRLGNPVPFRNAVSVEPDQEARFDRISGAGFLTWGSVRRAVEVKHRGERRQSHPYQRASKAYAF